MEVAIGPALVREAEEILKLQYLCYQAEAALYDDYALPPLTQTLADLLAGYDTHAILVARLGGAVVGSASGRMAGDTCHIGRLIVHPRLQRRGLGTRLLRAIEGHFHTAARYALFTGHRSEGNLRLYSALGYGRVREEAIAPHLRLVHLERPGAPP